MGRNALISLILLSAAGFAAESDPVKAPYVEVGDCWTYRARNIDNRGPIDENEECITFVDRGKRILFAVVKLKPGGRELVAYRLNR